MLTRSLRKNITREIRSTLSRFIAIFAITALGAGFFAGLKATSPNMKATADRYYSGQRLMDYRLLSTMGFTGEDIALLRARDGVEDVMAVWGLDLLLYQPGGDMAARFNALPADTSDNNPDYLNRPVLLEGRMPAAADECLADSRPSLEGAGYQVGDVVTLSGQNDAEALELMAETSFTVVGLARSPYYVSIQRGNTNIGNGRIGAFFYLHPLAFEGEYYTDVYLTDAGAAELSAFSDAYAGLTADGRAGLEAFAEERAEARYREVAAEAQADLDDARAEVEQALQKLDDARREIADGETALAETRAELDKTGRQLVDAARQAADGGQALARAEDDLAAGQRSYDEGLGRYNAALAEYGSQKARADQLIAGLGNAQGALDGLEQMMLGWGGPPAAEQATVFAGAAGTLAAVYEGAAALMREGGGAAAALADQIDGALAGVAADLNPLTFDAAGAHQKLGAIQQSYGAAMHAAADGAQQALAGAWTALQSSRAELDGYQGQLAAGRAQLEEKRRQLANAEAALADGRRQLAQGLAELEAREQELADGRAEYDAEKAKADREIADAEQQIADGQRELDALEKPRWVVQTRADNPGYSGFASDADRIDAIAAVIPVFFYLVAALVCLTTMTRMVEEQRVLIGTFKSLGYGGAAIAAKYIGYAAIASISGAVAGVAVGYLVFPRAIWQAYGILYQMPALLQADNLALTLASIGAAVLCTTLATLAACLNELHSAPARLLRQKAPKAGKRVILERIPLLWRRLGFMAKVTARNLLRYKKRFFMTVLGVAGCTALLLTGFGLRDSISGIVSRQYGGINQYDIIALLTGPSSSADDTALNKALAGKGESLYIVETLADAASGTATNANMTTYISVPEDPARLPGFVALANRQTGGALALEPDAVVITEKLASRLRVSPGDTIRVNLVNEAPVEVRVSGVAENYIFNYIYMAPGLWQRLFGAAPQYDTALVKTAPDADAGALLSSLVGAQPVAGASDVSALSGQFDDMFASLDAVVWLIILAAGMLAFVVLYNLTNINITERRREIATLKVLGFHTGEVASYVYRENLLLTLIGIGVGLVLGVFLHDFVVATAEVDEVMFRRVIEPLSYLWSVLFTLGTAGLVNLVMMPRLRRVDMVDSLKSME